MKATSTIARWEEGQAAFNGWRTRIDGLGLVADARHAATEKWSRAGARAQLGSVCVGGGSGGAGGGRKETKRESVSGEEEGERDGRRKEREEEKRERKERSNRRRTEAMEQPLSWLRRSCRAHRCVSLYAIHGCHTLACRMVLNG